jgi:hypothetical protein
MARQGKLKFSKRLLKEQSRQARGKEICLPVEEQVGFYLQSSK